MSDESRKQMMLKLFGELSEDEEEQEKEEVVSSTPAAATAAVTDNHSECQSDKREHKGEIGDAESEDEIEGIEREVKMPTEAEAHDVDAEKAKSGGERAEGEYKIDRKTDSEAEAHDVDVVKVESEGESAEGEYKIDCPEEDAMDSEAEAHDADAQEVESVGSAPEVESEGERALSSPDREITHQKTESQPKYAGSEEDLQEERSGG